MKGTKIEVGRMGGPGRAGRLTGSERRRQIVRVAASLFAEKGFVATTTRELAAACGVSEAVIYKHFSGKEELFETVLRQKMAEVDVSPYLESLPSDISLLDAFRAVAGRILDIGLGDPLIQKLLLAATIAGSPEAQKLYLSWRQPFTDFLEKRIRRGIDQGEVRPVDPVLTARAFIGLVNDCVLNCNLYERFGFGDFNKENSISNNVPIFVRGIAVDGKIGS